jgi:hypothetical protein
MCLVRRRRDLLNDVNPVPTHTKKKKDKKKKKADVFDPQDHAAGNDASQNHDTESDWISVHQASHAKDNQLWIPLSQHVLLDVQEHQSSFEQEDLMKAALRPWIRSFRLHLPEVVEIRPEPRNSIIQQQSPYSDVSSRRRQYHHCHHHSCCI